MPSNNTIEIAFLSNDTFREIFQSSAEGIIMVDKDGKILMANPVSERIFGYNAGELMNLQMENLLPQRFRHKHTDYRRQFNEHPQPRRMGVGRDLMAARKDGTEFPVEVSLSHKVINDNFVVIAFIIDITERKKAEEALKRSEEQLIIYAAELEKKVKARTEALDKTIRQLEKVNLDLQEQIAVRKKAEEEARKSLEKERELNELKSKFVSIASHEFRTPLSTILSSSSLIKQYLEKGDVGKAEKHTNRIKSSVNHLTSILNDFLSLGKLEEGKIEIIKESVQLAKFFSEIQEDMRLLMKPGQSFVFNTEGPEQTIDSDPRVLRNIFLNLISNAIKYSGEGKKVYITVAFSDSNVIIRIKDEGIGIPEGETKHIFDRFFRASNATNIQGTGLGLNIVKRYVDLLDGDITFSSEPDKGSSFIVTLPY